MNPRPDEAQARGRAARFAVTAAAAAAALALASCGGGGPTATVTVHDASGSTAATAAAPGGAAHVAAAGTTGAAPASAGSAPAATDPTTPADVAAANPVHPSLARLSVSGGPLTVVVDEPSGPFGQQNELIRQGAEAAVDVLNARGGVAHHAVRIVAEPLDGLSPAAVQQRLRAAGANTVLVLPCDTDSQASLAAGASSYRTVMLAPCDADASLAQRLRTYWPIGMSGSDEAEGLVHYMTREGFGRVFIVNVSGLTYATTMTSYVEVDLRAAGISIVGSTTVPASLGSADAARVLNAVKSAQPASLFTALPPPQFDRLGAALANGGQQAVYLFGTAVMDTPLTLSSPGSSALEGTTFTTYGFARQNAEAAAFERDYKQRFGRQPVGGFPGLGFETMGLLEEAIAKAHSTSPAALQQAMIGGLKDNGVALFPRSYVSPTNHNPATTVSVEKVNAGTLLPLLTTEPNGSPPPPLP